MGITCQLVRLRPAEVAAIRTEPMDVLDLIDWDEPSDRWVDLDQAWTGLLDTFSGDGSVAAALLPGEPLFDDGGQTILLADPDLVRSSAVALDGLDPADLTPRRSRWRRRPETDVGYLTDHFDALRDCYRRAAADGEAIAVVIS